MTRQEIVQWGIDMSRRIKENPNTALMTKKIGRVSFIVLVDRKYQEK